MKENDLTAEKEKHLLSILDEVRAYIFTKDLQGRYTFANTLVCDLFGYPLTEIIGFTDEKFFVLSISDGLRINDRRVLDHGERIESEEVNVIRSTGETRVYWSVKTPLRGVDGSIVGLIGISTDITERKRTEDALREIEEKFNLLVEYTPAAIALFDRNMCYLAVSRYWLTHFGLAEEMEIVGLNHYEVFPDIPERWKTVHRRGLAGEVVKSDEDRFERLDGSVYYLRWEVLELSHFNGQFFHQVENVLTCLFEL